MREQHAELVLKEDAPAEKGDTVVIDFNGTIDGVPFEGGKSENYSLELGSNTFIPGFEDQLVGHKADEDVDVKVTFPEDYQAEDLQGKEAVFATKIHEVKAKELPELDDDFAKDVSEFDTLADYKADIKKNLTEKKKEEAKREKEAKAVAKAVENASMDIPEGMIKLQVNNMVNEFAQRLQMQGLSIDQYIQYMGSNHQQFMESLKPEAVTRIKNSLVLEAVVKAENITATEDDFEEEVKRMADMYKMEVDKVKEILGDNEKEQIMSDLAIQKAAELIASKAVEKAAPKAAAE